MRILAASEPMPLDALQMGERNLRELKRLVDAPYGLFLVVGPTGSGKTTTFALLGVLAQRLARTLCKQCKVPYHPPEAQYEELRQAYGAAALDALGIPYGPDFQLYRGVGCAACSQEGPQRGYRGRVGLYELLVATPEIKRLIQQRARIVEVAACAQQEGMTTLLQDGVLKVLKGVTDMAQVKAVASK